MFWSKLLISVDHAIKAPMNSQPAERQYSEAIRKWAVGWAMELFLTSSFSKAQPQPQPLSPLFNLPGELRNEIWKLAVVEDKMIHINKASGMPEPTLLLTCKAVRREALSFYYHLNEFQVHIPNFEVSVFLQFKDKLKKLHIACEIEMKSVRYFLCNTGEVSWPNFKRWLRMRHDGTDPWEIARPDPRHLPTPALHIRAAMLSMVTRMRKSPWSEVEPILEGLRKGLINIDSTWAKD